MADATAAFAYTAVVALDAADKVSGFPQSLCSFQVVVDKVIADNVGVTTQAEAEVGIFLALGAHAAVDAAAALRGEFPLNNLDGRPVETPAVNVLFVTHQGLYLSTGIDAA